MSQQEIQEEPHLELFKENIESYRAGKRGYTFSLQRCKICKSTDFCLFVDSKNGRWTLHCTNFADDDHQSVDAIIRIR